MTSDDSAVVVAWARIAAQLDEDTTGRVFMVFRPNAAPRWSLSDDQASMDIAVSAKRHANDLGDPAGAYSPGISPSPYGPVFEIDHGGVEEILAWISDFATHLSDSGVHGVIEPAPHVWMDQWLEDEMNAPKMTVLHAYTLDPQYSSGAVDPWQPPDWGVDSGTTSKISAQAVQWCSAVSRADIYLEQGSSQVLLEGPCSPIDFAATLLHGDSAGITQARRTPMAVRRTHWSVEGQGGYQIHAPGTTWRERLDAVTMTLSDEPSRLDLAVVRLARTWVHSWLDLASRNPGLPWISEADWRTNRPLWSRFTPDAHGVQVLTEAHLARAHDLSNWDIDEIAPGRYLVQAEDLEPWFAGHQPDPDVLTAARNDFGDMILTREAIGEYGRP